MLISRTSYFLINDGNKRFVEASFTSDHTETPAEYLKIRLPISEGASPPPVVVAELECLRAARNVIADEIQRLECILDQADLDD